MVCIHGKKDSGLKSASEASGDVILSGCCWGFFFKGYFAFVCVHPRQTYKDWKLHINVAFHLSSVKRAHPAGRSFHLPGESVGNGARWTEGGGEISAPAEVRGGRLKDQRGGTDYKPADRQVVAGPLGGEMKPET